MNKAAEEEQILGYSQVTRS